MGNCCAFFVSMRTARLLVVAALALTGMSRAAAPAFPADWAKIDEETMQHFQALLRMDTSDPPGNELPAVEYLKRILEAEGIETKIRALESHRPNLIARLRGNGSKKPLLLMAHTDVVNVDLKKWKFPPFSATRDGGYVYGRGTVDDKDNVAASLMVMLMLKRSKVELDRDVIFLAEAGEEGSVRVGIEFLVREHFDDIRAEYCLAEGGGVRRTNGQVEYASVQTTEKIPAGLKLTARGVAGHGSVPLRTNAVVHMARAVAKVAEWQPPMRLNETTRAFFTRLAEISSGEDAARYRAILRGDESGSAQEYFAEHKPSYNSVIRTSISPNIISGGYRVNIIPSEVEATLDVRALPDEDVGKFIEQLKALINDPVIEITRITAHSRPGAPPSRLNTEAFKVIEDAVRRHYDTITLPTMSTGATDMAFLRANGVECFGIGPMTDTEDGPKGFGAHSDQERILEASLFKFVRFNWDVVVRLAAKAKP
jgi:acetylornithine deacetylase/succinyl-diaminopimelate desuccinylase-like protein